MGVAMRIRHWIRPQGILEWHLRGSTGIAAITLCTLLLLSRFGTISLDTALLVAAYVFLALALYHIVFRTVYKMWKRQKWMEGGDSTHPPEGRRR